VEAYVSSETEFVIEEAIKLLEDAESDDEEDEEE